LSRGNHIDAERVPAPLVVRRQLLLALLRRRPWATDELRRVGFDAASLTEVVVTLAADGHLLYVTGDGLSLVAEGEA
jgi:hypothetical protein